MYVIDFDHICSHDPLLLVSSCPSSQLLASYQVNLTIHVHFESVNGDDEFILHPSLLKLAALLLMTHRSVFNL